MTLHNNLSDEDNTVDVADLVEQYNATEGELSSSVALGEKIYDRSSDRIYMFLGDQLPENGNEVILNDGVRGNLLRQGSFIFDKTDSFYVATSDIEDANVVELKPQRFTLGSCAFINF